MFLMIFDFFECEVMYLKSACPQCLVKAEGAEDLATWPLVVINHYAGDYEMYTYIYMYIFQRKFRSQTSENLER